MKKLKSTFDITQNFGRFLIQRFDISSVFSEIFVLLLELSNFFSQLLNEFFIDFFTEGRKKKIS